jgi:hypothetical protein
VKTSIPQAVRKKETLHVETSILVLGLFVALLLCCFTPLPFKKSSEAAFFREMSFLNFL